MTLGVVGKKIGMTRVFQEDGGSVPVTVVEVEPNRVTQVKEVGSDGYCAIQVTTGTRRPNRVSKAAQGHFAKAGSPAGRGLWEFQVSADLLESLKPGTEFGAGLFEAGQMVDVQGTTKGKGFAGVMKRHGFRGGRATHGNSKAHRKPGSIGQNQDPGRVFPGKKMAGQMGNVFRTQQNLEIVRVDAGRNLLLIKGALPGPKGFDVVVQPSVKGPAIELNLPSNEPAPADNADGGGEEVPVTEAASEE